MRKINIAYFCSWTSLQGIYENLKELWYIPKRLYQRMKYGVCYLDVWNFEAYLAEVIANGCENLKHSLSYPGRDEADTPEKWKAILDELIKAARNYNDEPWNDNNTSLIYQYNSGKITKEEYDKYIWDRINASKKNYNKFIELLTKWYADLWD